jgi:anti-sigma B factor antagonist
MAWLCSDSSFPSSPPSPSSPGASSRPGRSTSSSSGRARPPSGQLAIEVDVGPGATTVFIRGELDLVTIPVFAEQLTLALRENPERLVLDMAATDFMDCGSARLIAGAARSLPGGGRLVIRRPGRGVRRMLELTGLDAYCEIDS